MTSSFVNVRRLWLCAVCSGLAGLSGCGGGTSSSPRIVSNSCSIQLEALRPPCPPGVSCATLSNGNWNNSSFQIILSSPAVSGVNIYIPWNTVETSQQSYDFSSLNQQIAAYSGTNKKVNLMWMAVNYGNVNDLQGGVNTMTPAYVFTTSWANSVGASTPQDVAYCEFYPGNGTFVNTTANANTAGFDSTGYPVVYEKPFMTAYQNFIGKVIQQYNGNSAIGYMRFGLSVGDEADAYCTQQLQGLPSPNTFAADPSPSTWENYVQAMDTFEHRQSPAVQLMESMNSLDTDPGVTLPDFEASTAVSDGFGFGSNGWQNSDIQASASGTPCTSDWCTMFDTYQGRVPLELQTATPSDPVDPVGPSNPTGNLADLIPLAVQHHATILELALPDLYLAFDPNYSSPYSSYHSSYNSALSSPCAQ
ncbi:MAG TPA: hypothetical protein VND65_07050 [Candidatus Binatia bacterium]|nr:hypothetical protein [Candidatus Binatia bacterium]